MPRYIRKARAGEQMHGGEAKRSMAVKGALTLGAIGPIPPPRS